MLKFLKRMLLIDACLLCCIIGVACSPINSVEPFDAKQATLIIHKMYPPNCFAHPELAAKHHAQALQSQRK